MFLGEYKHTCDNKNRLRLPPRLKADVSGGLVLTKGNDGCLFIVPKNNFDQILEKVNNLPMFDSKVQLPLRMLFSSAVLLQEDNQGRFLLPANLKDFAKIQKEVVFIGMGNRIELWAQETWNSYCDNANANFDQILSNLGEYGI